jgi:hypothetical protein
MAESSTVTILRNKVEEIDNRIRAYEREIEIARKNLVAVQMTLAVFQSTEGVPYHAQKPVSLSKLFRRGELPTFIFDALRDHPEGLDTRELAAVCLKHRDLDTDDIVLRRSMAMKIINTLDKLRLKGRIEKDGMRAGVIVWRMPN